MNENTEKIITYITTNDPNYSNWYVGIAENPERRLFIDHNVSRTNDLWIYAQYSTDEEARNTEEYIIQSLGTDGDVGGGSEKSTYVYSYRKTTNSRE